MKIHHRFRKVLLWGGAILVAVTMFPACAAQKQPQADLFFEKWRARAESARGFSPSARKREAPVLEKRIETPPILPAMPERPLPSRKTTLEMQNAEIAVLLRALARAVEQDIMINESVQGKISINVKEAPWDQVFLGVMRTNGLTYGWQGDIIHIITLEDRDKNLKQLETEQKILSKKREMEMVEPLITQIVSVDYADADKLKANLEAFLSEKAEGKPLGSIMVDVHTNALIIQAIRSDLERILPIIAQLDQPTQQVLIEAHIVEATSSTARELGIQWGGLHHGGNYNWITAGANSSGITGATLDPSTGIDPTAGYAANFPGDLTSIATQAGSGFTIGYIYENIGQTLLSVQLSALQAEGKLNILSSPSITTLDNQKAIIESGDEVPFQTVEDNDVKIQYKKAVLSLEVTPHIIQGDTLKLNILTSKDELDFSRTVAGNPTIVTKKAQTNVILFNGQTTVIGGLNKETKRKSESGVPGLKDIPLLGYLFKGQGHSDNMEEVLIFITPHILNEKSDTAEAPALNSSASGQPTQ